VEVCYGILGNSWFMPTVAFQAFSVKKRNKTVLYCNVTLRRVPVTVVAVVKLRITYCVSVSLFIQHARRMRCIILSTTPCLPPSYFSTLSYKRHDFRKNTVY